MVEHLHTYVSMCASAPFLLLLYRKEEYGLKHLRRNLITLGFSDFSFWSACGRWSLWEALKLALCCEPAWLSEGFFEVSEGGTDMISTFKANNPCKDANKPDLST